MLAMKAVPMAVVARQLGHSDTRMTEKHYAHLAPDYVADTIRRSFPRLTESPASDVASLVCDPRSLWQHGSNENTNGSVALNG
jgi:hypothetical protein